MPSIRNFKMTYDAINDYGTFSEGDTITGKVTLELEKDTKVESMFVKAKGDVSVHWSEKHGDNTRSYSAHRRLFKQKHFLIPEEQKETIVASGVHVFKFSIKIPLGNMPSSFRGSHGKVVYKLEAKLCRSWRMDRTDEKEIYFSSRSFLNIDQMMFPQSGSTNKEVGVFSKGTVQMDATVDRRGYAPGDTVTINAKINNSSSKDVTPKFSLIRDVVYRANGNAKYEKTVIHKEVGGCVQPQTHIEVKSIFKIPSDAPLTIHNCDILSVEYHIKAYLDISFSSDPEVVFPEMLFFLVTFLQEQLQVFLSVHVQQGALLEGRAPVTSPLLHHVILHLLFQAHLCIQQHLLSTHLVLLCMLVLVRAYLLFPLYTLQEATSIPFLHSQTLMDFQFLPPHRHLFFTLLRQVIPLPQSCQHSPLKRLCLLPH